MTQVASRTYPSALPTYSSDLISEGTRLIEQENKPPEGKLSRLYTRITGSNDSKGSSMAPSAGDVASLLNTPVDIGGGSGDCGCAIIPIGIAAVVVTAVAAIFASPFAVTAQTHDDYNAYTHCTAEGEKKIAVADKIRNNPAASLALRNIGKAEMDAAKRKAVYNIFFKNMAIMGISIFLIALVLYAHFHGTGGTIDNFCHKMLFSEKFYVGLGALIVASVAVKYGYLNPYLEKNKELIEQEKQKYREAINQPSPDQLQVY